MQAVSQNQLAAYYVGIPVKRVYSLVWGISAGIAATAGILVAPVNLIDPLMGFIGIKAFAAAIVGGFGSLPGAIVGGLVIGIAEQFVGLYLPPRDVRGERIRAAPGHAHRAPGRHLRDYAAQEGLKEQHGEVRSKDPLRAGCEPVRAQRPAFLVRPARRLGAGGAAGIGHLLPGRIRPRLHLGHRGGGSDAAGGVHRPGKPRPCGVPGDRRLCPYLVAHPRRPAGPVGAAGHLVLCRDRLSGGPAGTAHDRHLSRDRDARVRAHRRLGHRKLGTRHGRALRHSGAGRDDFRIQRGHAGGVLLSLSRRACAVFARRPESAPLAHRACFHRREGFGDFGPERGHRSGAHQVYRIRHIGRLYGARRLPVRAQDRLPLHRTPSPCRPRSSFCCWWW